VIKPKYNSAHLCGKNQNPASVADAIKVATPLLTRLLARRPFAAVMKQEPLVLEPTGVWGRRPHIAFSRYAALRGGDTPLLAAGFFSLLNSGY
jgi:hypothetical protein